MKNHTLLFVAIITLQFTTAQPATFTATEILGRPTDSSVTVNLLSADDVELYFEYGTTPGTFSIQTDSIGNVP
jgi:hypothetical protein